MIDKLVEGFLYLLITKKMSKTKWKVLLACSKEGKNIHEISKELKVGYQAVYRHIEDLEKLEFIEVPKAKKKTRGKIRKIKLTKLGKKIIKQRDIYNLMEKSPNIN